MYYSKLIQVFVVLFSIIYSTNAYVQNVGSFINSYSGITQYFYEYLPPTYNNGTAAPVIIFLHGDGEKGSGLSDLPKLNNQPIPKSINDGSWDTTLPFVVLSPQCKDWPSDRDINDLMGTFASRYGNKIDLTRVYLTGLSAGGFGGIRYLSTPANSVKIAAAAFCSTASYDWSWFPGIAASKTPLWFFVSSGEALGTVTWTIVNTLKNLSMTPTPKETNITSQEHNSWLFVYNQYSGERDIYHWFLGYTNQRTTTGSTTIAPTTTTVAPTTTTTTVAPTTTTTTTGSTTSSTTGSTTVAPTTTTVAPTTSASTTTTTTTTGSTTGTPTVGTFLKLNRPTYGYIEYRPSFTTNGKYPLIIYYHGSDAMGNGTSADLDVLANTYLPKYIKDGQWPASYPFLVVAPQTNIYYWDNAGAVFDDILATYGSQIDLTRVYVAGQGRGAVGIVSLFDNNVARGKKIAGAQIVRVFKDVISSTADFIVSSNVSTWWYTNQDDPYVPYAWTNNWVSTLNTKGLKPVPISTVNPTGSYNSPQSAFNPANPTSSNLYSWFLSKTR